MPETPKVEEDLAALTPLPSDSPALRAAINDYRRRRGDIDWDAPTASKPVPAYDPPRK